MNKKKGEKTRIRTPDKENGEMLGLVLERLGGLWLKVKCADNKKRKVRIPGSQRRVRIYPGDVIIIKPWYGLQPDSRADVVWKYKKHRVQRLLDTGFKDEIKDLIPSQMQNDYW